MPKHQEKIEELIDKYYNPRTGVMDKTSSLEEAINYGIAVGREEAISDMDEIPRAIVTFRDGSRGLIILQHSIETHGLAKKTKEDYLSALSPNEEK